MKDPRPPLILTRPLAASERFAAAFRTRFGADWPVILSPLMRVEFLSPDLPSSPVDHLVFTSETAVAAYARLARDHHATAWCVGPSTAAAARSAGFVVKDAAGDGRRLAMMIKSSHVAGRILWPHGTDVAHDIAADLAADGIATDSLVVYAQATLNPSPAAIVLMNGAEPLLLPLFSPRSARLAVRAFGRATAPLLVAALSPAIAAAASPLRSRRMTTAARPDSESLLEAMAVLI